jgi:hypothetical protein
MASISKPTIDGNEIEQPTNCTRNIITSEVSTDTIGGTTKTQSFYRKYQYQLEYDPISYDNYHILELLLDTAFDTSNGVTFIYDKWTTSQSPGVICVARLSDWEKVGGDGTIYYGKCTLTLTEVVAR